MGEVGWIGTRGASEDVEIVWRVIEINIENGREASRIDGLDGVGRIFVYKEKEERR